MGKAFSPFILFPCYRRRTQPDTAIPHIKKLLPRNNSRRILYKGCSPYPFGHHGFGIFHKNLSRAVIVCLCRTLRIRNGLPGNNTARNHHQRNRVKRDLPKARTASACIDNVTQFFSCFCVIYTLSILASWIPRSFTFLKIPPSGSLGPSPTRTCSVLLFSARSSRAWHPNSLRKAGSCS